jgi:hypothetical protein
MDKDKGYTVNLSESSQKENEVKYSAERKKKSPT